MTSLRVLIEAGAWPADEKDSRRLALRATSRISDPDLQHDLRERLLFHLGVVELDAVIGSDSGEARRAVLATLAEIEAASRPN